MGTEAIDCIGAAPINTLCGQKLKFGLIRLTVFKLNTCYKKSFLREKLIHPLSD